jgi:crotonobetainyl-CoA:carnitine CoA-transferase CaiB-like acyl-CoA transferase
VNHLPLSGIRVLDCSRVLAGPFATMLLADLGADVIKLEPPAGDETRRWGPPFWGDPDEGRSAYFASVNRNKRSIVVDLQTDAGRSILDRLAARADLLVHNFRPSTAARLGLDEERLRIAHPQLIVAIVGGFPGTDADRPAYDLLAQAMSGLMSVTGEPDGPPLKVGVGLLDLITGLHLAIGALAALVERGVERGHGRSLNVGLVETGVTSLINVLGNHLATGNEPARHGNAHPNIAPYQSFAARDGHVVIAVGTDAQFGRLLSVLGLTDAAGRFATNADRLAHRDELASWLGDAVTERRRDELVAALQTADVPAGPVLSVGEALASMGDGWLMHSDGMRLAPDPITVDGERAPLRRPPPRLGEHTSEVLAELES